MHLAPMKPLHSWAVPAVVAIAFAWFSGSLPHALDAPYSLHEWRQRDALSLTLRYMEPGRSFWEPAIHFQHAEDGRGAGEFTGLYFVNAGLWKLFGRPLPWTLRWTQGLFLFLGLVALSGAASRWSGRPHAGPWVALVAFASPLIQFYGINYLVNPSALMSVFIAWWMGARSEVAVHPVRWLVGAAAMLAFAGLLRPTMLLGGIPLLVRWWQVRQVPPVQALLLGGAVVGTVGAWVVWAKSYNAANASTYFLTTLRPLWDTPDVARVWEALVRVRLQELYHVHVRWLIAAVVLITAVRAARLRVGGFGSVGWTGLALLAYGVLWFKNLDVHDYYLLEFLILAPLLAIWVVRLWSGWRWRRAGVWVLALVGLYQIGHSVARNRVKWDGSAGPLVERFVPHWEREEWDWFHADQRKRWAPLDELAEQWTAWGVPEDAWVLSIPDPSPNISLTRMGRFGFTSLYENDLHAGQRVSWAVERGARYLVVNKPELLESGDWGDWLSHPVGVHRGIQVFALVPPTE